MSAADEPEYGPRVEVTIEFPEGLSDEQVADGEGMTINIVASEVTGRIVLTSILRAAEAVAADAIRGMRDEEGPQSVLFERDENIEQAMTSMNARLLAISTMSDMAMIPNHTMGFSI